jgi:hypothetical protein
MGPVLIKKIFTKNYRKVLKVFGGGFILGTH